MIDHHEQLGAALAGRYEIERELGRGGMAIVYLARDVKHGRRVALKVLRQELASTLGAERFLREIAIAAPLVHPNILALHDSGEAAGFLYYVMPFIDGSTLRQRLDREAQLPIADAIAIATQVAAALDYAHERDVVHRDIKPENILLLGSHVLVADFGLARAISTAASTPLTDRRVVLGTPPYMSPEQCRPSGSVDRRSDIYSLGCVVFEMIAGVTPFRGATPEVMMSHHLTSEIPSVCRERTSCPSALDSAVRRALAKAPADRFRTAGEFAAALTHEAAPPDRQPVVAQRDTPRRWRRWSAGRIAAVVALLTGLAFLTRWLAFAPIRLGDEDWIVVADFVGPPDEPSTATAVRELVTQELNQSKTLRTVSRQQLMAVMRLAQKPETLQVNVDLARELATRSAVRVIVAGNVTRMADDLYSIAVYPVRVEDRERLFSLADLASQRDLIRVVGKLGQQLRQRLGERKTDTEATLPLFDAATPSFPAYKHYVEGLTLTWKADIPGANARLREAIAIDSQFASAWAALGTNHLGARQLDSAQHAFSRALAITDRLTPAQQYRVQADVAYTIRHDIPAALHWYDRYLAEYPQSVGGRNNRGLYASSLGRYEDAVFHLRTAIDMSPFGAAHVQSSLFNLVAMLVALERFTEAEAALDSLQPPLRHGARLIIAVGRDHWAEVSALADSIDASPNAPPFVRLLATTSRASALAAEGSVPEASRLLRHARDGSTGATARWYDRADLLLTLASGSSPTADAQLAESDSSPAAAVTRALRAAVAGDTIAAHRYLRRLATATDHEVALLGNGPDLVRGWIAAAGDRWDEVTQPLAPAAIAGEHDATLLDRVSSAELRWLVATGYAARGKLDSAAAHMKGAIAVARVPAGHLVLRGLILPEANRRISSWSVASQRVSAVQ